MVGEKGYGSPPIPLVRPRVSPESVATVLITFDIDDTIRLHGDPGPAAARRGWMARWIYREPLRAGFPELCISLRELGCQVGIYTTSDRSAASIRRWLRCYGIQTDLIVNAREHRSVVEASFPNQRAPSKHPGRFGVDLHIDDSPGVAVEGQRFGFRTLIIDPGDREWCQMILAEVSAMLQATGAPSGS